MLREYKSHEEKQKTISLVNVADDEAKCIDFIQMLEQFYSDNKWAPMYRGCTEAKHMMYNSGQRHALLNLGLTKDTEYHDFLQDMLFKSKTWNNSALSRVLGKMDVAYKKDVAFFSFLQHSKIPTPFLDFTYHPHVAIYFAIEEIEKFNNKSDISNYVSVYFINSKYYKFQSVLDSYCATYGDNCWDFENLKRADYLPLIDDVAYYIENNVNIFNQEGLFISNNSLTIPLEEQINKVHAKEDSDEEEKNFGCYHFHKKLAPQIREYLNQNGINRDSIYSTPSSLKKHCLT